MRVKDALARLNKMETSLNLPRLSILGGSILDKLPGAEPGAEPGEPATYTMVKGYTTVTPRAAPKLKRLE